MRDNGPYDTFHTAERWVQAACDPSRRASARGEAAIRASMPAQHQRFFEGLGLAFAATLAPSGQPRAHVICGVPGFMRAETPHELRLQFSEASPALQEMDVGNPVGLLGIDFGNGRRNRANGVVGQRAGMQVSVNITHSFGNCAQYVHHRRHEPRRTVASDACEVRRLIANADTFFIASRSADLNPVHGGGVDLSHRGGEPGFVRWADDHTLSWPDYAGNNFFNTLGNIRSDPRVALLFIDFDSGRQLHVRGTATLEMNVPAAVSATGRQVVVRVAEIEEATQRADLIWPLLAPAAEGASCAALAHTAPRPSTPPS